MRPSCWIAIMSPFCRSMRFGGRRRDERGVVPRQLGHRLRQFLQPAVVREAAVVDRRVAAEVDLDAVDRARRGCAMRVATSGSHRRRAGAIAAEPVDEAVVQPLAPLLLEEHQQVQAVQRVQQGAAGARCARAAVAAAARWHRGTACTACTACTCRFVRLPVLPHDVVAVALRPIRHRRDHFVRRLAAVQRLDQRLHDRHGAVDRARVAPRFEVVRGRACASGSASPVSSKNRPECTTQADLAASPRANLQSAGAREHRVRLADDHQHLHAAGVDVGRPARRSAACCSRRHDFRRRQIRRPARRSRR